MNFKRKYILLLFLVLVMPILVFFSIGVESLWGNDRDEELQATVEELEARLQYLTEKLEERQRKTRGSIEDDEEPKAKPEEFAEGCFDFTESLKRGQAGQAVKELQQALEGLGYYDYEEVTGYYGPVTEEAVKRLQADEGVVSSGEPETTGWGVFGPRTRQRVTRLVCQEVVDEPGGDHEPKDLRSEPDIRGEIYAIKDSRVLVAEGHEGEVYGGDIDKLVGTAMWFTVTEDTELINEQEESLNEEQLEEGMKVVVFSTGPVLESYPAQATAARVEVDLSSIDNSDRESEDIAAEMEELKEKINERLGDRAEGVADCRAIAFGAKPCGGPWKYLVYSATDSEEGELQALIEEYNELEGELNTLEERASDCAYVMEPEVELVEGRCVSSNEHGF